MKVALFEKKGPSTAKEGNEMNENCKDFGRKMKEMECALKAGRKEFNLEMSVPTGSRQPYMQIILPSKGPEDGAGCQRDIQNLLISNSRQGNKGQENP